MKHICGSIEEIIKTNIADRQNIFVFNSQVASESWALWCVNNLSQIVDMERFIAWDEFTKRCTAKSSGHPADSTIRRMFTASLIAQNAASPFLETVIPRKYAADAQYLSAVIAKRLPALNLWKRLSSGTVCNTPEANDYNKIYDRYVSFMRQNNLFETSWQAAEPDTSNKYILFYPVILEDWVQYQDVLASYENITAVDLSSDFIEKRPSAHLYPNARMEIRKTALHIRQLLSKGEDAASIALSVPDLQHLRPYIEREMRLYDIPFVTHIAPPLYSTGIGRMFGAIYNCYAQDFSLSSVRTLLQSCSVPWREYNANGTIIDWTTELVRLGSTMRCLCHYAAEENINQQDGTRQNIDPWDEIFRNPAWERERGWYDALKSSVSSFVKARDFAQMRQVWFTRWRDGGLLDDAAFDKNSGKYDKDADAIISRCITALYKAEQAEKSISVNGIKNINHYEFFLEELKSTLYSPQSDEMGVNIFDYKVASFASYKHNILINASQGNVTVSYKMLDFLPQSMRDELFDNGGLASARFNCFNPYMQQTRDVSKEILSLYAAASDAEISCSSEGFSGFDTPHSYLLIAKKNGIDDKKYDTRDELDKYDFVTQEREYFANAFESERLSSKNNAGKDIPADFKADKCLPFICDRQIKEISAWAAHRQDNAMLSLAPIKSVVFEVLGAKDGAFSYQSPLKISPTAMNNFFPCARKWLFKNVLNLRDEETFDTDLMPDYSSGRILHSILEIFCKGYLERNEKLPITAADGTFGHAENRVLEEVKKAVNEASSSIYDNSHRVDDGQGASARVGGARLISMPLVSRSFELQSAGYVRRIMDFLHKVCKADEVKKNSSAISKYFLGGKYVEGVEIEKTLRIDDSTALHGRLDCVLQTESGDNIIVDYKSGTMPSITDSTISDDGEIADFQMPMYAALMDEDAAEAAFFHIGDGKDSMAVSPAARPIESYHETVLRLKEYAKHFAKRALSLDLFPEDKAIVSLPFAAFSIWEDCPRCPFASICRKTYTSGDNMNL